MSLKRIPERQILMLFITNSAKKKPYRKSKTTLATHVGHIQESRINLFSVLIHKFFVYKLSLLDQSVSALVLTIEEKSDTELWVSTSA